VCSNGHFIGVSYDPEWWPEEQWNSDLSRMKEMGITVVRIGDFTWAAFEPREGVYQFDWVDRFIALSKKNGIDVILCTPTAGIPPWLYKKNPDVLGANDKGLFDYGGRKGFAIHSPTMQQAAERMVNEMAKRYASNPTVIGWQISNEPGYPFTNFDKHSLNAFRQWLKNKYGTIDKLNEAWWGIFWSNRYNEWDEIMFPNNSAEGGWRSGSRLDYRQFFSDSFLWWLDMEGKVLRRYVKSQFVFTNWPDTRWSVDIFKTEPLFDITAWDNYSALPGSTDYRAQYYASSNHDLSRCSRKDNLFFVAEQGTQAPTSSIQEGVRLQTYLGLAHGSQGTLFYEWRPPLGGNEQAYKSILHVDGSFGPAEKIFRQMTREMKLVGKQLANATTESDLAMIYSYNNQWEQGFWNGKTAFEIGTSLTNEGYDINFQRYYNGMKMLGRNVDVISPESNKSKYQMIVAPGLQMVSDREADEFETYVRQGGILVLDPTSGTRDVFSRTRPQVPPGVFASIAGIKITTTLNMIRTGYKYYMELSDGTKSEVVKVIEGVELNGAKPFAYFRGPGMDGKPAITINKYGKGYVVYVAAVTQDVHFFDGLFSELAGQFKIAPLLKVPQGIEVVSRKNSNGTFIYLLNLTADYKEIKLPKPMFELLSNKNKEGSFTLPPFDVVILKQ